ncbi:hypothetical protein ACLB2K_031307 [Fragaria x ananassa]
MSLSSSPSRSQILHSRNHIPFSGLVDDVGEAKEVEAHGGDSAAFAELDGAFGSDGGSRSRGIGCGWWWRVGLGNQVKISRRSLPAQRSPRPT